MDMVIMVDLARAHDEPANGGWMNKWKWRKPRRSFDGRQDVSGQKVTREWMLQA